MGGGRRVHLTEKEAKALGIMPDSSAPKTVDPLGDRPPYDGAWYAERMGELEAIDKIVKAAIPIPTPTHIDPIYQPRGYSPPPLTFDVGQMIIILISWFIGLAMGLVWR